MLAGGWGFGRMKVALGKLGRDWASCRMNRQQTVETTKMMKNVQNEGEEIIRRGRKRE